jgi:hypothetical protein
MRNGWLVRRSRAAPHLSAWRLGSAMVAVLLLVAWMSPGASADSGPLSIRIGGRLVEDAGTTSQVEVSWTVSGGTLPYAITLQVTDPQGETQILTSEEAEGMRRIPVSAPNGGRVEIEVKATDRNGATVSGSTLVQVKPGDLTEPVPASKPCGEFLFSTEEDFVTFGPVPADGNPIISDGDLLGRGCIVCARNRDLLRAFDISDDLGLDSVDVLSWSKSLIAFSTELDSPHGTFGAGDLLLTNGAIIPNNALLSAFDLSWIDLGLDAVHFVGEEEALIAFATEALKLGRDAWARVGSLQGALRQYGIDIWFSTEGTERIPGRPPFLDGDLLSARDGTIVASNAVLLPVGVPAGIPQRGVDFGLDAVTGTRDGKREGIRFSTEILHEGIPSFTDGDVLAIANGIVTMNSDLVRCFEPRALEIGLDALYIHSATLLIPAEAEDVGRPATGEPDGSQK